MPRGPFRVFAVLVAAGLVTALTACGKKPPVTAVPPPPPPPVVNVPPPAPPPPTAKPEVPPPQPPSAPKPPTEEEIFARMTIEELNAKGYLEDVLFEYDKAELTDAARTSLQKNADWLRKWSSTRITVEGHADERGTNEYNLALGERRAAAVRDFLSGLGVPAARMNIVSKGEEEPACREETEGCWTKNRRGHFVITAKN